MKFFHMRYTAPNSVHNAVDNLVLIYSPTGSNISPGPGITKTTGAGSKLRTDFC